MSEIHNIRALIDVADNHKDIFKSDDPVIYGLGLIILDSLRRASDDDLKNMCKSNDPATYGLGLIIRDSLHRSNTNDQISRVYWSKFGTWPVFRHLVIGAKTACRTTSNCVNNVIGVYKNPDLPQQCVLF